jgi:hypothetical protein
MANKNSAQECQTEASPRDALNVDDAGLILLWPYLSRYFDQTELLKDNQFRSDAAAARGVMLLRFLATGETSSKDPKLALAKVLCGLPFEAPIPKSIDLDKFERTVSEGLLAAVWQNWTVLKNSSIDSLRGAFLQREGSLTRREEPIWRLKVEPESFDILLDRLPWTIGMVKLPFMAHPISMQWRS